MWFSKEMSTVFIRLPNELFYPLGLGWLWIGLVSRAPEYGEHISFRRVVEIKKSEKKN